MSDQPLLPGQLPPCEVSTDIFNEIKNQEQEEIKRLRSQRLSGGEDGGVKFAVAFSGGGIRAAAFQCGVLWRLAEMNLLKDVTYLAAVSGGGYITMAFATHCVAEPLPEQEEEVKAWYLRVVAKTVTRMQSNVGDFVRDFWRSGFGLPDDNSGCLPLPRILDTPILIVTLVVTVLVHPLYFFLLLLLPMTMLTEAFFGDLMRGAFCAKRERFMGMPLWWYDFTEDETFVGLVYWAAVAAVATVSVLILQKVGPFKDPNIGAKKGERVKARTPFLVAHGLYSFLVRFTLILLVVIAQVTLAVYTQIDAFVEEHGSKELFNHYCPEAPAPMSCSGSGHGCFPGAYQHMFTIIFLVFIGSIMIMPYAGSGLAVSLVCLLGPVLLLGFQVRFAQFRVFGPLTGQDFMHIPYTEEGWDHFVRCALILTLILVPLYPEIRAVLHTYYMRCLSHNFFAGGQDVPMVKMKDCPYCPFMLLTGTSSDYKPPIGEDDDVISELSFTSLHCGSIETGYVGMPHDRTIGKCTALTAAGCVDAAALTISQLLTMRFWLEALNLSWGDYLIFKKNAEADHVPRWLNITGESDRRLIYRLPADTLVWAVYVLLFVGHFAEKAGSDLGAKSFYLLALMLFTAVFGLSFFSLGALESTLGMSPLLRQMQQATAYCYRGDSPPPLLYVTDGGCRDCTTLVQLLMRREERILLVLAAADPTDDLAVLKTALDMAKQLEFASFYNPVDPRRDVGSMFEHFKFDKTMEYLHIGISYPLTEGLKFGHLYIVKNRLPPSYAEHAIEPHLTEEEIRGEAERGQGSFPEGVRDFDPEKWEGLTVDKLGALCCCDCAHHSLGSCGNCGPKFPHGSFANFMYMSPMWCSSLTRMAFDMCGPVLEKVTAPGPLEAEWESHVGEVQARSAPGIFRRFSMESNVTMPESS